MKKVLSLVGILGVVLVLTLLFSAPVLAKDGHGWHHGNGNNSDGVVTVDSVVVDDGCFDDVADFDGCDTEADNFGWWDNFWVPPAIVEVCPPTTTCPVTPAEVCPPATTCPVTPAEVCPPTTACPVTPAEVCPPTTTCPTAEVSEVCPPSTACPADTCVTCPTDTCVTDEATATSCAVCPDGCPFGDMIKGTYSMSGLWDAIMASGSFSDAFAAWMAQLPACPSGDACPFAVYRDGSDPMGFFQTMIQAFINYSQGTCETCPTDTCTTCPTDTCTTCPTDTCTTCPTDTCTTCPTTTCDTCPTSSCSTCPTTSSCASGTCSTCSG